MIEKVLTYIMDHALIIGLAYMGYSLVKLWIEKYFQLKELKARIKYGSNNKKLNSQPTVRKPKRHNEKQAVANYGT